MPYLSHYTNRSGLEGIAETHSLWGTNFLDVNDSSEFLYAWSLLLQDALRDVLNHIPDDQKRPDCNLDAETEHIASMLRGSIKGGEGYGHLYMTSFAQAATDDQEHRGILTLWDRYTRHQGYCLQFDRDDLKRMMSLDSQRSNYGALGLKRVCYGIDPDAYDYRELRSQLAQRLIVQMLRTRPDLRVEPKWQGMWAESYLERQILDFCATHKDPCFEDEREIRLFGYPVAQAESRVFFGMAYRKPIRTTANGKRYVVFGESWKPGIWPRRIIIGAKADPNIDAPAAKFPNRPEVVHAELPIA